MRDDDEDETYAEKYIGSLTSELIDGLNPIGSIPFIKDIWSLAQGYDVARSDMDLFTNLRDAILVLFNEDKSVVEKTIELVKAASAFLGVPAKNIMRDYNGIKNFIITATNGNKTTINGIIRSAEDEAVRSVPFGKYIFGTKDSSTKLYDAIMSGNQTDIDRMKSQYDTPQKLTTAIRSGLRKNEPRIHEAAQARLSGDIRKYSTIVNEIITEGNFDISDIESAVSSEEYAIKELGKPKAEPEEEADNKASSVYKATDLNATLESGDMEYALEIIADMVAAKIENGMTEKEAKSSLRSSVTAYWKQKYKDAYKSKNTEEMKRIRELLYDTGLYGRKSEVSDTVHGWLKEKD